ncbi:hypothetical protein [Botrimarina sp.]|uniref:hypothetical protein n=1 Tax=Botrimarina sp. TaxID=2795802 RepID=UPI0032EBFEE2
MAIFDGFGDADIDNNGVPLEETDVDVGPTPPMGLPNTYVPARLEDANGDGPANPEVTSVLDASDTGIRWFQIRGWTGGSTGSNPNAGTGEPKPTIRIVDDTQGAMQETSPTGLNLPAIDSGYAMSWESRGGGSEAAGFFDRRIELGPEPGDEVKVSFDYRLWRDAPNANATIDPVRPELRFGLFQDTDNQLGMTNPFAGRQEDLDNDGFVDDTPAVWGEEGGFFEGDLTGDKGPGDDIGSNGDNGWTASVFGGNPVLSNGGGSRIREELQADRILQGQDTHTIAAPENLNPDPFGTPIYDFVTLDNDKVYNLSLSLVRDTIETPGDTITATLTVTDLATNESWSLTGTEGLEDATSGGIPIPGTGGPQSDSWDYFALRNATSGSSEFDFLIDNFMVEVNGSNAGLAGDYNNDGLVDAADYTVWRDGQSPDSSQAGYDLWAQNYGASLGGGSAESTPEPGSVALAALAAGLGAATRRRVK